ncbi:DNA alkylation repair protein [uncultured Peptoniphilus sp.]|uniref:DNA alkylation repair protein n=1 Tax=uncultured Peptoniphilus sp. TaxID=254354 RepID=UPI002805FA76|nr:DNA alkylation repair protein [uncultured Peptoniphilus sp.]
MNLEKYIDKSYREFNSRLIPGVENVLGIRVPILRKIVKEMNEDERKLFLKSLPHKYHEENIMHMIIISEENDYNKAKEMLSEFLPFVDNWQVCDAGIPKAFKKLEDGEDLLLFVKKLISKEATYFKRYGIFILMKLFLDDFYNSEVLDIVANIKSEEYYVNMMRAWFFQEAMVKRCDDSIKYLEEKKLDRFTHLKTISKCVDSRKIDEKTKLYLKSLR